jgi:hypothetical protein
MRHFGWRRRWGAFASVGGLALAGFTMAGAGPAAAALAPSSVCLSFHTDMWTAWLTNVSTGGQNLETEFWNCSGSGSDKIKITVNNAEDPPDYWFHGAATGSFHVKHFESWNFGANNVAAHRITWSDGGSSGLRWRDSPGGGGGGGPWVQAHGADGRALTVTGPDGVPHPLLVQP